MGVAFLGSSYTVWRCGWIYITRRPLGIAEKSAVAPASDVSLWILSKRWPIYPVDLAGVGLSSPSRIVRLVLYSLDSQSADDGDAETWSPSPESLHFVGDVVDQ